MWKEWWGLFGLCKSLPTQGERIEIITNCAMLSSAISLPTEGAWIEMMHGIMASRMNTNRFPCGERELKFRRVLVCRIRTNIAPHAGSVNWNPQCMKNQRVDYTIAPHAGNVNWNMESLLRTSIFVNRSPSGERELKFSINTLKQAALLVAPHTGSVNWNLIFLLLLSLAKSRAPYRERELKSCTPIIIVEILLSLPTLGSWIENMDMN